MWQRILDAGVEMRHREGRVVAVEDMPDPLDVGAGRGLVEGDAKPARIDAAEIDFVSHGARKNLRGPVTGDDRKSIEKGGAGNRKAQALEPAFHDGGKTMHAPGDSRQSVGTVIHRVHAGHDREQHLRGADVRRRLLATDVLLACLQREAVRGIARSVHGHADQATRHRAFEVITGGEVARVRTAVTHRHAEPLRRAHDDVGAPFAGRNEQG